MAQHLGLLYLLLSSWDSVVQHFAVLAIGQNKIHNLTKVQLREQDKEHIVKKQGDRDTGLQQKQLHYQQQL